MVIIVTLNKFSHSFVTLVHCKVSFVTSLPTELARQKHLLAISIWALKVSKSIHAVPEMFRSISQKNPTEILPVAPLIIMLPGNNFTQLNCFCLPIASEGAFEVARHLSHRFIRQKPFLMR